MKLDNEWGAGEPSAWESLVAGLGEFPEWGLALGLLVMIGTAWWGAYRLIRAAVRAEMI